MERLFARGVEKVSLSAAALADPDLITRCANEFGSQSVLVTIDVKRSFLGRRSICSHNGRKNWKLDLRDWVCQIVDRGAGEIIINNVDRDGTMAGYDHELVRSVVQAASVPVIALGGARDLDDIRQVIFQTGAAAAAAGSLFVFSGKRRAVLINYPTDATVREG
jgi:cyclase